MSLSSSDELDDQEVRVASIHPSPAHSAAESSSSASSRAPSAALGSHMHLRDDSGNSAYRAHLSPNLQLSTLETGASSLEFSRSDASSPLSSIHSGRSSALDSGATRPSPQLLYAINHTSPTREQQQQQQQQTPSSVAAATPSSRGNSAAGRTGSQITPPPNVAGRMPPNLALERPALPTVAASPASAAPSSASKSSSSGFAPPTFTATSRFNLQHQQSHSPLSSGPSTPSSGPLIPQATRGRSWSMGPLPSVHRSPAGAHAIAAAAAAAYANLTPPIGAGAYARRQILLRNFEGRSALTGGGIGSGSGGDHPNEEEAEDELLLGASASLRALRNRAHSQPGTQPIPMDMSGLEPIAWSSKGSRLVIYCASGILFLLIFCFFIVVALRMAAHTKYNNHLCVVRDQERQAARGAPAAGTTAAFEAESISYADSVSWTPNYDVSSWDRAAFQSSLKSKWAADQSEETRMSSKAQTARAAAIFEAGSWLPHLRLHHLKVVGTHNSYHQPSALPLSMHQYAHASLPVQLANYRRGVRQLELDLHIIPNQQRPKREGRTGAGADRLSGSTAGFVVYHLQWLDDRTSCYCLSECLDLISLWSGRHPAHFPLYISFEIKSRIWEDVDTGLRGVTCQDLEDVEAEIAQVFPREKMVTPWEVRGGRFARAERKDKSGRVVQAAQSEVQPQYATVREALQAAAEIEAHYASSLSASSSGDPSFKPALSEYPTMEFGWPRLVDSLGKIVLVWLDDMHNLADQLDCMQEYSAPASAAATPSEAKGKESTPNGPAAAASTPLTLDVSPSSTVAYNPGWFHSPSRLLFIAQNSMDAPYASFVTAKHPSAAMLAGLVRDALTRGLMVRTMTDESVNALPDPARFAAALRSGAQILSTDFEECMERSEFHQSEPSLDEHDEPQPQGITGAADTDQLQPNTAATRSTKLLFDTHIHDDAHEPHAMAVPALLPSSPLALSASQNSSSTLYCEHLPSEWPFECAQLAAPFFCESALYALRLQRDFAEASATKGAKP